MTILLFKPFQWLANWGLLLVILLAIFNLVPASVPPPLPFSHTPALSIGYSARTTYVFVLFRRILSITIFRDRICVSFPCVDLTKWVPDIFSVISA